MSSARILSGRTGRIVRAALALLMVCVVALVAASARLEPGVLCVLPALVLALALMLRRYPGERMLVAFARVSSGRGPCAVQVPCGRGRRLALAPRGSLLLALSLAVRPPPVLLAR